MKSHHLPLVGMVVSGLRLSLNNLPDFAFGGYPARTLELERAVVSLARGNVRHQLSRCSATPPDGDQKPFVEILGSRVREAIGHSEGVLSIKFEDGWELTAEPVQMAQRMYTWNWIGFAWRLVADDTAWIAELGRIAVEEREKLR